MITIREVIGVVAVASGVEPAVICGRSQVRAAVRARHLTAWLSVRHAGFSAAATGRALGGRDHTTMLASLEAFETELKADADLKAQAERLARTIEWKAYAATDGERDPIAIASAVYLDPRRAGMAASVFDVHALAATLLGAWAVAEVGEELARLITDEPENQAIAPLARAIAEEMAAMRGEPTKENDNGHAG